MKLLQGVTFMNEDNKRRLAEWYGTRPGAGPVGYTDESERTADLSSQIPPRRPSGSSPTYREPFWSEDGQEGAPPRKKHFGARVAGICTLAVVIIAATALLFSNSGRAFDPIVSHTAAPGDKDMQEFFENYYDDAKSSTWSSTMPRAETGTGVTLSLTPRPEDVQLSLSEVYERCIGSVVAINTVAEGNSYLLGSGIIMTGDGYILTNSHVLDGAKEAVVTLWDDRQFDASLVGADSASDLAVIKIDADGLPAAEFCAGTVHVGEAVAAIGNPLGTELRGTMTDGIVSAVSRDMHYTGHPLTLIQTNAAINEGNSGGPLLNMQGQVVGMTSMKLVSSYAGSSIEGIGFAIPTGTIKEIADELIENGRVLGRPALGITVGAIPSDAAQYFEIPNGLYVKSVGQVSDAAAKGIRTGDVITSVNGTEVLTTSDLSALLDNMSVGDIVTLTVYRSGSTFDVDITLQEFSDIY